jgi:hypothetical protein
MDVEAKSWKRPTADVCEIIPGFLYLGSRAVAEDIRTLRDIKVTHIVNCSRDHDDGVPNYWEAGDNFTYLRVLLHDFSVGQKLRPHLGYSLRFIQECRRMQSARVFVHCHEGFSLSASIVIAYMMQEEKLTYTQAFSKVRLARGMVKPNAAFARELRKFQEELGLGTADDDNDDAKTVAREDELGEKIAEIEDCKACLAMMQQLEEMFVELNRVDMGRFHFDAIQDKIGQIGLHV